MRRGRLPWAPFDMSIPTKATIFVLDIYSGHRATRGTYVYEIFCNAIVTLDRTNSNLILDS